MELPPVLRVLTRNAGWKALSVLIAFLIWLNVASQPELATIVSVPVVYKNYPPDLDISSDIASSIRLEARGPSRQLRSLSDSRIAAVIDFASVKAPGERTFTLSAKELNLPRGIDLMRTVPAQLRFRFENRMTRMIPVDIPSSGALPAGVVMDGEQVQPPELEVTGPESHVLAVKRLIADPLDLTRVNGNTERSLTVYAPDAELHFVTKSQVKVEIHVHSVNK